MSDADELARRYFALWADYLTALVADPQAAELLQRWIQFTGQFATVAGERAGSPFPFWPPVPGAVRPPGDGPQAAAAPAAGAPRQRDDAVGQLARRVAELERRLAALEPQPGTASPRRRDRPGGKR